MSKVTSEAQTAPLPAESVPVSNRLTVPCANAPTIKKDLTVEVEEAMDEVEGILVGWSFHSGFPSEDGLAALAVIRAALTKP